ncbi:hypothetical protein Tco_0799024 [Tanacetum coccineum]
MGTLSLVSEYLKDLEECMDDGDSKVAKEAKLFNALEHKSVVIEVDNQKIAIFTKAPLRAFGEPFMRYSLPCKVDGQELDAELDLADFSKLCLQKNELMLATTKRQVDFKLGEIRMNLTKFKEGIDVIDLLDEVGSSSEEVVKIGKANRNKGYNINKLTPSPTLKVEEIPPTSTIPPQPIYPNPKTKGENERGKERLNKKEFSEEDKVGIIEHGLPKKMCDPGNYVFPVKINGVVEMVALVDTRAIDGQGTWDAELDLADSANYVTEKVLENMGFVHVSLSDYNRKMVNDVNVEIHGVKFKADFVILDYVNEGESSILFGRDFLATTKSQVDFGLGEIRMNLTKFKEGIDVIDLLEEVGSSGKEVVKMGKANRNKG